MKLKCHCYSCEELTKCTPFEDVMMCDGCKTVVESMEVARPILTEEEWEEKWNDPDEDMSQYRR